MLASRTDTSESRPSATDAMQAITTPRPVKLVLGAAGHGLFRCFAQGGTPSPLQHTWSLAVEEQFYLLWPLLQLACRAVRRRRLLALSLAGVAASALATYVLTRVASPGRVYFGTDTRAQELLAGAALAALLAPTWRWWTVTPQGVQSPQPTGRRPMPLLLSVCGLGALTGVDLAPERQRPDARPSTASGAMGCREAAQELSCRPRLRCPAQCDRGTRAGAGGSASSPGTA